MWIGRHSRCALGIMLGATSAIAHSQAAPVGAANTEFANKCASLAGRNVGVGTILKSEMVQAGATLPPFADKTNFTFCRVQASASAGAGSSIKLQMWLPATWNGKFLGLGGGGFDGGYASSPLSLRGPVASGYAALTTDAGHTVVTEPSWARGQPAKIADYGNRANHVGALFGKALIQQFYDKPAAESYFHGCSNGGRDALMLAQRHPDDYDAIVAGAPANEFSALMVSFNRIGLLSNAPNISLTAAKLELLHKAAIAKCDMLDGIADGLITVPSQCRFDPAVLECDGSDAAGCLSKAEVQAVRSIYRGAYTKSGRLIMPGLSVGNEYEWYNWLTSPRALGPSMGRQYMSNFVYDDPTWTAATFDADHDFAAANKSVGREIDARDADLRPFFRNGGKLLMYHGWDDAAIPAANSVRYFAAMRRVSGTAGAAQSRLFMLPGVAHCNGGNGPSVVDYVGVIDQWQQSGTAPDRLVATKPASVFRANAGLPTKIERTGAICAWPKGAKFDGKGQGGDPASFECH